ncbi:recombinase family protein [Novosphingobium sp. Gsoil 351]|uniref:recombinase family protein n=1 Tax=Novosphingobium sp. Gsoil 351 TaxID=2675225 RepID=UPI0012B4CD5E|nr:recombinase family protein [Novosphingobium sp. Gsoil 351]QGN55053.1 recombinase family protein [Novosphingobium sp. Gsoil 351]
MAERKLRCAVYTRKSTEDGLEQEFNSLDAQYEACAAYAVSQRHEGWVLNPERYDDGGFSGGNMERPGMKRLLADVTAGKVDIILLYKIDRLTRSLADFAKIVEVLDKAGASFVSITQSFNTTTSMGRLTLNMLLSFAQFEREVTGERIRDKIAASKRKGMWMGGPVPLGYRVENRKLVVDEVEADLVRHIMQRYLEVGSVVELADELNRQGHRTKVQNQTSGPHRGGCIFRRGTLYHLLRNRAYQGMIVHKGEAFPGEHEAIVSEALWNDVQCMFAERVQGHARRIKAKQPSLLVGKVFDGEGRAMTPSHATKPGRRYRYYITRPDLLDGSPAWRVSAHDIEKLVSDRLAELLVDQQMLCSLVSNDDEHAQRVHSLIAAGDIAAAAMRSGSVAARIRLVEMLVERIVLADDRVEIAVSSAKLLTALGSSDEGSAHGRTLTLTCAATRVRRGHQVRLVIPAAADANLVPRIRDEKLVALVAEAHAARKLVLANSEQSLASVASAANRCRTRLTKLAGLACLAPDIVTAILEGRQPLSLTNRSLLATDLPLDWAAQREALGFS